MQKQRTTSCDRVASRADHSSLIDVYDSLATARDFMAVASMACGDLDEDHQSAMARVCSTAIDFLDSAKSDLMALLNRDVPAPQRPIQ